MFETKSFRVFRSDDPNAECTKADRLEICADENNIIQTISFFRVL